MKTAQWTMAHVEQLYENYTMDCGPEQLYDNCTWTMTPEQLYENFTMD